MYWVSPFRSVTMSKWSFLLLVYIILVLNVSLLQAWTPTEKIAKNNENDVEIQFRLPSGLDNVPLISIKKSDMEKPMVYMTSNLEITIGSEYKDYVSAEVINKDQKIIQVVFEEMKPDYAGTYQCTAGLTELVENCRFKLIVLEKPDTAVIEIAQGSSLLVGQSVSLQCVTNSNSLPSDHGLKPFFVWKDGEGKKITSSTHPGKISVFQNGSLVISDITRSDKGMVFTCKSADDPENDDKKLFSKTSEEFVLTPQFAPGVDDISIVPDIVNNSVIIEHEGSTSLDYSCSVECEPVCNISWKRLPNGADKYKYMPRSIEPHRLRLNMGVWRNLHGPFRCEGYNIHGTITKGFRLEVQYITTPNITSQGIQAKVKHVFEGDNEEVQLQCIVDSSPAPIIVWKTPENWVINQSRFSGPHIHRDTSDLLIHRYSSNVTLKNLACEDGGSYKCEASNSIITKKGEMEIDVKCKPSAIKKGQYKNVNDKVVLKKEYVWDLSSTVTGEFVVRGWPRPEVKRVYSTLNGNTRQENDPDEISVNTQHPYSGKNYLTLFNFHVKRDLTLADRGRVYTFEMENSDFNQNIQFSIQPRGPPLAVSHLNATEISSSFITLSWTPEFDGGEAQSFSIYIRETPTDPSGVMEEPEWMLKLPDIPDENQRMKVKVNKLSAAKSYDLKVMSINSRGNVSTWMTAKTKEAATSSASAGTVAGIVLAVIFILLIIAAVLFYFLIYKKRCGKDSDGESRIPMIGRMSMMFRRGHKKNDDPNGNVGSGAKKRPIYLGKTPKPKNKDYANIPTESVDPTCEIIENPSYRGQLPPQDDTETFINADLMPLSKLPDDEIAPSNGHRTISDDGLTYVKIDFNRAPAPTKPPRFQVEKDAGDAPNPYCDIDFAKTRAKEEEMKRLEEEEEAKRKEAEKKKEEEEEEEEHYENVPSFGTNV